MVIKAKVKIWRQNVSLLFIIAIFCSYSNQVYASTNVKTDVVRATKLLEEVLEDAYEQTKEDIQGKIVEQGYDYELTMQTFYNQGNPFADMDYIKLIAAYCVMKEHGFTKGSKGIQELPFLSYEMKEQVLLEYEPLLIYDYVEISPGVYEKGKARYLNKPETIKEYAVQEDGTYRYLGQKEITLEKLETQYAQVCLNVLNPDLLETLIKESPSESMMTDYRNKVECIGKAVTGINLNQTTFIRLQEENLMKEEIYQEVERSFGNMNDPQKTIADIAMSLIGRVPYEWGGKSGKSGYDTTWYTFRSNGNQKGLDCSGFVQWVYRTAGVEEEIWNNLLSTRSILDEFPTIGKESLRVGDLGVLNNGNSVNHVGIYLGNENWIHCSSSKGTVIISKFPFTIYKQMNLAKIGVFDNMSNCLYPFNEQQILEEDALLLAQYIDFKVGNEGFNGWVAVGETVLHKVQSKDYPDTLKEVVLEDQEFSNALQTDSLTPSNTIKQIAKEVLHGSLKVLDNEQVVTFREITEEQNTLEENDNRFFVRIGNLNFYKN